PEAEERRMDHGHTVRPSARTGEFDRAQGRDRRDLANDQPSRHAQGNRPPPELHRRLEELDRVRDPGSLGSAPTALAWPEWNRNECRVSAHGWTPIRNDRQGPRLCPAPIHYRRRAAT